MASVEETLRTPDQRYIIVDGYLWRAANPHLDEDARRALVADLMAARRAVYAAVKAAHVGAEKVARARVHKAKVALGERGPPWWSDGAPDYTRRKVENSPYAAWYDEQV